MTDMVRTHGLPGLFQTREGTFIRTNDQKLDVLFLESITAIKNGQTKNNYLKLCSCNSADNGRFSNAQAIANRYNIRVMGFYGKINKNEAVNARGHNDNHPIFQPQTNRISRKISELGNVYFARKSENYIIANKIDLPESFPN